MDLSHAHVVVYCSSVMEVVPSSEVVDGYVWELVVESFETVPILFPVVIIVLVFDPVAVPLLGHGDFLEDLDVF